MKSEPATPPIRFRSAAGVPVSAAMVCAVGGSAEGRRAGAAVLSSLEHRYPQPCEGDKMV